jgi:acetoin utilization protein AcuB
MSDTSAQPTVREYMTADPTTLGPDDPLLQAVLTVRSLSIRHIPIVKDGELVGLITDRDLGRASPSILGRTTPEEYNLVFQQNTIQRVMVKNPTTIHADALLGDAVRLMQENKWGCIPVVDDDGKLAGILTITDVLRYTLTTMETSGTGSSITLDI